MRTQRIVATASPASSTVERDKDGVPTAFRIWRKGANPTDYGVSIFDARSAELLMAEQETRGNRYPVDVNHLSLNPDAPLENQRAVGTFALEVRDGELWAVACRWTAATRADLAAGAWYSISPAYDVEKETGRIVSFINCALTGSPATHSATQLAASRIAANRSKGNTPMLMVRHFTDNDLRVMATRGDSELRRMATAELRNRGAMLSDPDSDNGRALARMRASSCLAPPAEVRREGRTQTFPTLTAERAREIARDLESRKG